MRSAITIGRTAALGALVLLAGCADLLGIIGGRPPSIVERDGLSYQVIVSESRYDYDAFEYRIRITNTSRSTIERWLPRGMARARIYRDDRWTRPVWDECDWGCDTYSGGQVAVRLRRDEAIEGWWGEVRTRDFASYGRGIYYLTVLIDTGRNRFEVLGLPELRVR